MKQTSSLHYFGFGFLLAAGLALLLVIGSGAAAQSAPSAGSGQAPSIDSPQTVAQTASSIGTAITYQGTLDDDGSPANGTYNFRFRLYDGLTGGTQLGEVLVNGVAVSNGRFTVQLDFGVNAYAAEAAWLEIAVDSGGYQTLTPRQPLTPAPLALNLPNVYTDPATGFVGIGTDTPVTGSTLFTVKGSSTSSWGGMYMSTSGVSGRPFYGYSTDGSAVSAWHEYNGSADEWRLYMGGGTPAISVNASDDMHVRGDVTQELESDGTVKAAVYTICGAAGNPERSFNNVNSNSILTSQGPAGRCTIDFGFDLSNRFWSATAVDTGEGSIVTCTTIIANTWLSCARVDPDGNLLTGDIIVIVY
ncbi:MAG: hypothetical protein HF973_12135 [Chloroflexi bacterium]|nr:hypothetical protein [Chloroflexota bacterium]